MNVLLLRGLSREQRHWGEFPALLKERLPGSQITMLDLPGAGTEHRRECPPNVPAIAEDLRARFQRNGQPHAIVAVSLGGMIALDWCSRWPEDFVRAVVINTSSGDLSRPWERLDPSNYGTVIRGLATSDLAARERAIVAMTINRSDFDRDELVERWANIARERPVTRANIIRQLTAAGRSKLPAASPVPTLVLASKADRMVRAVCSERIAERLKMPLILHESGGHDLPFDDGPWVAEQVATWLRAR